MVRAVGYAIIQQMETLIHADVFFFVTTIAVIVVGATFTIALIYLIKILSDIRKISAQVNEEAILFRKDLGDLRSEVRADGFKIKYFIDFFTALFGRKKIPRSKKSDTK
jgi:hypothetical protein